MNECLGFCNMIFTSSIRVLSKEIMASVNIVFLHKCKPLQFMGEKCHTDVDNF